jgi:hypothetical protein
MPKISLVATALCFAVSAIGVPFAVKAEPRLLTAAQLDLVSAGHALPELEVPLIDIYLEGMDVGVGNINITAQVAQAIASATASCVLCRGDVIATALATANNLNLAMQQVTQQLPSN